MTARWNNRDREPRSIVTDIADEMDVLEVGPRVAVDLVHADHKMFRILHTVWSEKDYWHD